MTLTKEQLKDFIEKYFAEYVKIIDKLPEDQKDLFKAFKAFPIKVIAHMTDKGTLWEYIPNYEKFEVEIREDTKLPAIFPKEPKTHNLYYYLNRYLERYLDKAEELAKRDVYSTIANYESYEQYQAVLSEDYDRQYADYLESAVEGVVGGYSNYIATACTVKKKTFETYKNDLFEVISIIERFREHLLEELLIANCQASFNVLEEVFQDMESSVFLAVHGKYAPANALLRSVLENSITALYFDNKINNSKMGSRTYDALCKRRDDWVNSSKGHLNFTGDFGILSDLIDQDTDYSALEALKLSKTIVPKTFKIYVQSTYSDLCKYVHYRGLDQIDRFSLEFTAFDKKEFEDWVSRFKQLIELYAILVGVRFPEVIRKFNKRISKLEPAEQITLLSGEQLKKLF